MKKLFLLFFALATTIQALCQGVWTQKADVGTITREDAVGFSIGTKGYIGTGWTSANGGYYLNDFWEWDQASNVWTQKADFGGINRNTAVGFSIGTTGYIGLGYIAPILQQDFWAWDQASNIWTQIADFPGGARAEAVGFSIGSKGYVGTGANSHNGALKDFWQYDPDSDKWTQKADFGGEARYFAVGFSIEIKGYIGIGRIANASNTKDFWQYDPDSDKWSQKADFGGAPSSEAAGFVIGANGYIGTGSSDSAIFGSRDFWQYNSDSDVWIKAANYGGKGRYDAVGFSIGTKGYIGTGDGPTIGIVNDFWEFDSSGVSGIKELRNKSYVTLYPNPFTDVAIIKIETQEEPPFSLNIYNSAGEKISIVANINSPLFMLERKFLSAGTYPYSITDKHKNIMATGKFIIIN